jgi:hypothetical protein
MPAHCSTDVCAYARDARGVRVSQRTAAAGLIRAQEARRRAALIRRAGAGGESRVRARSRSCEASCTRVRVPLQARRTAASLWACCLLQEFGDGPSFATRKCHAPADVEGTGRHPVCWYDARAFALRRLGRRSSARLRVERFCLEPAGSSKVGRQHARPPLSAAAQQRRACGEATARARRRCAKGRAASRHCGASGAAVPVSAATQKHSGRCSAHTELLVVRRRLRWRRLQRWRRC